MIDKCKNLESLELENNTLGIEAAKCIGEALKKHPEFKQALWKDLFTGRMKTEIPLALKSLGEGMIAAGAQLTVLDCSDNALGPNGMNGLVDLLKSPTCFSLQELKLNNCGLGIQGGKMLAKALLECHAKGSEFGKPLKLRVLIAGRNRLENDGAKALAEVFKTCKTLEEIAMPQNGIYHVGISALSEAFKENKNLRILNLNDNTITWKGAEALAEAFFTMQNLQELNLGDCLLKTRGAFALAEALQDEHKKLGVLNLGFNEIRADGGYTIATAMENKPLLETLELNGNMFGTEGREQIMEVLQQCGKLDTLHMEEDESDDGEEEDNEDEDEGEDGDGTIDAEDEEVEEEEIVEEIEYVGSSVPLNRSLGLDQSRDISNVSIDESECENTVEAFCNSKYPAEMLFYAIDEQDKIGAIRNYLQTVPEENYLIYLVFTILKCAELSLKTDEALTIAKELFKDVIEFARKNNQLQSVRNFFLIQLGLLKSENKSFKPQYNIEGCRYALKCVLDANIIPEEEKNIYNFFLENKNQTAPIALNHP